ncbi:MAG TPA: flagellar export protein FliJ [Deltaproteobacteria bacterium]|jgi:flagellar FliJ protein|nr:flagellar export protein FliJ [Deltaproteobacteria bacterium]HOI08256.1 flagellar export protein FliJ [Deltaproteobacteria bacterium]
MGFRFRFETLSRVRKIREDLALQEFSKAQKKLQDLEGMKADKLSQRMHKVLDLMLKMEAGIPARDVKSYTHYIAFLEDEVERIDRLIAQARKLLDEKREELLKAKQEHKAMDRLREIDLERYIQEQSRQEMQFIDEIAIMRHGRRV